MSDIKVDKDGNIITPTITEIKDSIDELIRTSVSKPLFEIKTEAGLLKKAISLRSGNITFEFSFQPVIPLKYITIDFGLELKYESE